MAPYSCDTKKIWWIGASQSVPQADTPSSLVLLDMWLCLQEIIQELLISKEYVEFLAGRNGEVDQLVASTVRRCKRTVRDDNSALVLVLSYYNGRISQ